MQQTLRAQSTPPQHSVTSCRPTQLGLTVKVEGLIEPPLAQMASTKACYKLGLTTCIFLLQFSPLHRRACIIVQNVIFHLFVMDVNDKFHHTMQFHPAMSLQKVALPSPFSLSLPLLCLHSPAILLEKCAGNLKMHRKNQKVASKEWLYPSGYSTKVHEI